MRTTSLAIATMSVLTLAASSQAAVIISDDFNSYANDAALGASWTLGTGGTLDTTLGNTGNSLKHSGAASSHTKSFTTMSPTASESLRFTADIYDDAASANKRVTAGIRAAAGANIIEMGMYNAPSHYAYRVVLFGAGSASNWFSFTNIVNDAGVPINNAPVSGWHKFSVLLSQTTATFTLDLNGDGIINATAVQPITFTAAGMNSIRLGGPSAQSSTPGGANFDNVSLVTVAVPEPTSLAALGLVGGLMLRRRA